MPPVKVKDLRAATVASVRAVLGKKFVGGGVLVGLMIDKTAIDKLDVSATQLAKDLTKQASLASGIKLTPGVKPGKGGILVGFLPPKIARR